jgi:hypothetical protein
LPKRPHKPGGSPYKVLIWMGAAVVLLFLGILAFVMLRPTPAPYVAPEHERTLVWLYDSQAPGAVASAAVIEESRSEGTLNAVTFPAPEETAALFAQGQSGRKVQDFLEGKLQRRLHHRAFLPYSVVATLIDAAGGITVDGKNVKGAEAVVYLRAGGPDTAGRATAVLFALSQAVTQRGVNLGISEGLSLARQVDTDMDLTALPDVLARWSGYASPAVHVVPLGNLAGVTGLLQPDPPAPASKP